MSVGTHSKGIQVTRGPTQVKRPVLTPLPRRHPKGTKYSAGRIFNPYSLYETNRSFKFISRIPEKHHNRALLDVDFPCSLSLRVPLFYFIDYILV